MITTAAGAIVETDGVPAAVTHERNLMVAYCTLCRTFTTSLAEYERHGRYHAAEQKVNDRTRVAGVGSWMPTRVLDILKEGLPDGTSDTKPS